MKASFSLTATVYAALMSCIFFTQCSPRECQDNSLPAQWIFMNRNTPLYAVSWVGEEHCIKAMNGSNVKIEAVRADVNKEVPYTYSDRNGIPYVGTLIQDDYLLFRIPAGSLDKGSHVEIDAVIVSNPISPKYFIIEYYEGQKWKSVTEDLLTVEENPELKYSFRCSGIAHGEPHEHTSVYQTIKLAENICSNELKIRFRAVGDYTCSGEKQNAEAEEGAIGFATFGYTGAYIADLGTAVPADTTDILCIGNSFTYFSNTPSLMKEIAWSQGHYFNVKASIKGGQTLEQHTGRILTRHLAEAGGYDYVILQDQSQNPAKYASDPVKHADVAEGYMNICSLVLPHSPGCKVILEQTWAYPGNKHGGFEDFHNFTRKLEEGAEAMAAQNGASVSPIGNAYKIIWDEKRKEIRLFDSDSKHQSHYGSYLKACVNYLMITGEPFSDNVADCGLEPWKAATLRAVAERVVLKES